MGRTITEQCRPWVMPRTTKLPTSSPTCEVRGAIRASPYLPTKSLECGPRALTDRGGLGRDRMMSAKAARRRMAMTYRILGVVLVGLFAGAMTVWHGVTQAADGDPAKGKVRDE